MKAITRILVALIALMFLTVGVAFWVVPEEAAQQFGIEVVRGVGLINVRADLGGLFIGMGLLCGAGAITRRRGGVIATAVILAAVVVGRTAGWFLDGHSEIGVTELTVELIALALVSALAMALRTSPGTVQETSHRPLKIALATLGVLTIGSVAALLTPSVQQKIFDSAAMKLSARTNSAPLVDDAMRIAIAGSSAPLPSASRAKACVVVFAGGKFWVVDSGPESTENLVLWGIPLSEVGGVLLTHFHSDHIGDLGELQLQTWAGGRQKPLDVYGGPGIDQVVNGFNMAYQLDQGYRTEHHGESVMPSAAWGMTPHTITLNGAPTPEKNRTAVVYDDGALRITAIEVNHAPIEPAYAYRFDYKGRSAVITGDLTFHRPLITSAANADVLVSEAISRSMTHSLEDAAHTVGRERTSAIMHDVQDYHISPEEAAQIANEAKVKLLVYYHLLPAPDGFLTRRLFSNGVNNVRDGEWTIAEDGSMYTLPLNSRSVRIGRIE